MSERDSTCAVEYRPIPGFPRHGVGSDGTIWTRNPFHRRNKETIVVDGEVWAKNKCLLNNDGYYVIQIMHESGREKYLRVSHAVLLAFVGPRPDGMQCCHGDGNRINNALWNLRWDTARGNYNDRVDHGRVLFGESVGSSKIKSGMANEMRVMSSNGVSQRAIADKFGVDQATVQRIVSGELWEGVPPLSHKQSERLPATERIQWMRENYSKKATYAAKDVMWLLSQMQQEASND